MTRAIAALRSEVMALPAPDRLGYALALVEYYLDPVPDFYEGIAALGLDLCAGDARMLHALDKRRGRHVSLAGLIAARGLRRPSDTWPAPVYAIRRIAILRAALAAAGLPVEIKTWDDVGYSLAAPPGFSFEAAAPGPAPQVAR